MIGWAWFAFTAMWGMDCIPAGGHLGAGAAGTTLAAENSLRWHTVYPLWDWFGTSDPYPTGAMCHHPFGMYWLSAVSLRIFGHRDIAVNLPAVLMSIAMPPLLYAIGKHCWGPVAGAAAVLGYVLVPLMVGYSIFHNLEGLTIFGAALFYLGTVRYQAWGRRRDLAMFVVGALVTTSGDWVGYLILAPLLGWAFLRSFVLPSWMTPVIRQVRYHKWWALSVASAIVTLALWIWLFRRADKLGDWLGAGDMRGGAKDAPLATVLEARKAWIEFSFTPFVIALGKLGAVVACLRFVWKRRDEELLSLAMLFAATVQYVVFKRGADVHIFWPLYFVPYFALALAQMVATVQSGAALALGKLAPTSLRAAGAVALATVVLTSLILAPDGVRSLRVWRETGGRYDDKGALIRSHVDMLVVLRKLVVPHLHRGDRLAYQSGAAVGWEHAWVLDRDTIETEMPNSAHPFWVARASALGAARLKQLVQSYKVAIYGDTVLWTRGTTPGPVDAYSLGEHEPNLWQWMFTNNVEPVRDVADAPDDFLTWEWRTHLDQPATPPQRSPVTLDELRIAHNVAVSQGDDDAAERLRERIVGQLVRDPETHFEGGHELMGTRVTHGVQPRLEVWFQAGGPTATDTTFQIRSHIVRRARLSLIPIDETDREMAWPPILSTKLWKKGFIYKFECNMNHRIGVEQYLGTWASGPARRGDNGPILLTTAD
ncbi:MAG TPA: glycosyltransferase family 39 protein [Polyangiaceae bacterium]|nr:glycosyltransferase family 39 protein [Polyangiaceae bacterium]